MEKSLRGPVNLQSSYLTLCMLSVMQMLCCIDE